MLESPWISTVLATALFAVFILRLRHSRGGARLLWTLAAFALALTVGLRLWPGVPATVLMPAASLSDCRSPLTWKLRLDTPLLGLTLLLLTPGLLRGRAKMRPAWLIGGLFLGTVVLLTLAWLTGYVRWQPLLPSFAAGWLLSNLLLTVIPEEALFRGLLQDEFRRGLEPRPSASLIAALASAVLFGLAHLGGGRLYAALAACAGLFYGGMRLAGGSLGWPIAAHFLLNAAHFLLFTYPAWNGRPCS